MLATYKDLCIDAVDDARMQLFWAETLGLEPVPDGGGVLDLVGPTPQHRVWIHKVPEPVTVKQRVHLDVHVGSVDEVLARGATALDLETFRWNVLRDPEGGEFCAFVPRDEQSEVPAYRLYEIGVDSVQPHEIAAWWAEVIGGTVQENPDEGWAWIEEIPGAPFESLVFAPVPEPKTVKNRIHWDLETADVELLLGHGATLVRAPDDDISWSVLADPEGNEFCAFLP